MPQAAGNCLLQDLENFELQARRLARPGHQQAARLVVGVGGGGWLKGAFFFFFGGGGVVENRQGGKSRFVLDDLRVRLDVNMRYFIGFSCFEAC